MMDLESVEVISVMPLMPIPDMVPGEIVEDMLTNRFIGIRCSRHVTSRLEPHQRMPWSRYLTEGGYRLVADAMQHANGQGIMMIFDLWAMACLQHMVHPQQQG